MINLLLGPPGGGKSYEATVFHVLPALARGRKVITNLPLDLDRLRQLDHSYPDLVQFVENRRGIVPSNAGSVLSRFVRQPVEPQEGIIRAFSTMEDYADPWRHPDNGAGPLYVVDECHLAMPRAGTLIEVEEWYSLHRHESADVLLITQSYGKVSKSIIDLIQVCYRVKKATAFGSPTRYIRKVVDGVRGEVVNTSVRKYEKRYFGLYKSHTRGGGSELGAEDIVPLWKRWPFIGAAAMILLSVAIFLGSGSPNILKPKVKAPEVAKVGPAPVAAVASPKHEEAKPKPEIDPEGHPFAGRTLHIGGVLRGKNDAIYLLIVAQNGQAVSQISSRDLVKLGYAFDGVTDCGVKISHKKWSSWVICDAPQVGVAPVGGSGTAGKGGSVSASG